MGQAGRPLTLNYLIQLKQHANYYTPFSPFLLSANQVETQLYSV